MNNKDNNSSSGGKLGFVSILQLIFITLKLLGKISWRWLWVLSPTWISIMLLGIVWIIAVIFEKIVKGKRR